MAPDPTDSTLAPGPDQATPPAPESALDAAPATAPAALPIPPASRIDSPEGLLFALAAWLLATLGLRPLLLPDEGRYANVAREMLHGDLLVPTLNGLPFFHKPPLMYWLDLIAMILADITPFAGRFASMVGAWVMAATLYFAMRRWHGERSATTVLVLLATCPFFFFAGQYASPDMLVGALTSAAILAFARAVEAPPQDAPQRRGWSGAVVSLRWLILGWIGCALAVLANGPIGVILPALVIGPWLLARGHALQLLKLLHPLGLLAFVLIVAPWFAAMQWRFPGFLDFFFVEQHARRYAQTSLNDLQPYWFFLAVLPAATVPWALWMPAALVRAWRGRNATIGLYVWWVIAVVGFLSLPSSKFVGSVLPALAPWCALLALAVAGARGRYAAVAHRWSIALGIVICLGVVLGLAWQPLKSNRGAALVLAGQMTSDDRVVMVNDYFYDLPFYADLKRAPVVASRWDEPEPPQRDNWRKELLDAGRFDPAFKAQVLLRLVDLDRLSCSKGGTGGGSATWFVVHPGQVRQVEGLTGAQRIYADPNAELWRAPARACVPG